MPGRKRLQRTILEGLLHGLEFQRRWWAALKAAKPAAAEQAIPPAMPCAFLGRVSHGLAALLERAESRLMRWVLGAKLQRIWALLVPAG